MSTRIGSATARALSAARVVPGSPLMSRLLDADRFLILLRPARRGHVDLNPAAGPAPGAGQAAQPRALHPFRRPWITLWPTGPRHANASRERVSPTLAFAARQHGPGRAGRFTPSGCAPMIR